MWHMIICSPYYSNIIIIVCGGYYTSDNCLLYHMSLRDHKLYNLIFSSWPLWMYQPLMITTIIDVPCGSALVTGLATCSDTQCMCFTTLTIAIVIWFYLVHCRWLLFLLLFLTESCSNVETQWTLAQHHSLTWLIILNIIHMTWLITWSNNVRV